MTKRLITCFLAGILLIGLVGFVVASFEVSEYKDLQKKYSPQSYFSGYAKLKLDKEPANSLFITNIGDTIKLLDLLKLNNVTYSCTPSDCESNYESNGTGKTSLSFDTNPNNSKIIGLKFTENINSVDSVNFSLQSDAQANCKNQIRIDFLDNSEIDRVNNVASSESCENTKNYGCFVETGEFQNPTIEEIPYCQKMNLSEAPGFEIGAWVKKSGTKTLEMVIYDKEADEKAKCELPDATETGGEVSCNVNYSVTKEDEYYVCIKSKSGVTSYQTKSRITPEIKCGFFGIPVKSATASYQIFATAKKFNSVGKIEINDMLDGKSISQDIIETYLSSKYNLDCTNGCVVPIKFASGIDGTQKITVSDLKIKYKTDSGNFMEDKFYEIKETPAKISMDSQRINLDKAKFSVASNVSDYGNKTFTLKLADKNVFSTSIFLEKISTIESLTPLAVPAAYPMEYKITVKEQNNSKITKYVWDFGDGTNETTTVNKTTHTYNEIKDYELKITIKDINGYESSKTFNITVGSPKEIANTQIQKKLGYIGNLKEEISSMSGFYTSALENILDLNNSEDKLKELEGNYTNAGTDNDYIAITKEVVKIKIPRSIDFNELIENAEFYPSETNINLDALKKIGGGNYETDMKEDYVNAINNFMIDNLDIKLTYQEITGNYEQHDEKLLGIFEMSINKIAGDNYYIIIDDIPNLEFDRSYGEKTGENYVYIESAGNEKITFLTTGDIDFIELPVFMSPSLIKLNIAIPTGCNNNGVCEKNSGENWKNCDDCGASWNAVWIILGIFLAGLTLYIGLQEWYKRKYENYLFKNRNLLYNLVQYINQAREKGIEDDKIRQNLKKAGWSSEQINYSLKKYHGKRTGMWEIPNLFAKKEKI